MGCPAGTYALVVCKPTTTLDPHNTEGDESSHSTSAPALIASVVVVGIAAVGGVVAVVMVKRSRAPRAGTKGERPWSAGEAVSVRSVSSGGSLGGGRPLSSWAGQRARSTSN